MTIPVIYVFASTKGEYVNGEQRQTELYTAAVTEDGTELFRTFGTLDPMNLTYRADQHTALHAACVAYAPNGYELQWREPPANVGPKLDPAAPPEAPVEPVATPVAPVEPVAAPEPAAAPVEAHNTVADVIHNIENELKTLTEGL